MLTTTVADRQPIDGCLGHVTVAEPVDACVGGYRIVTAPDGRSAGIVERTTLPEDDRG